MRRRPVTDPSGSRVPPGAPLGQLSDKPLAQLLGYVFHQRLHGTLVLVAPSGERVDLTFTGGLIARVSTSAPVIYLGHLLYERGVIDDAELNSSLAEVASTRRRHGEVLLARQVVTARQVEDGLRIQRLRKVEHAFGLPPATSYAFHAGVDLVGERPDDLAPMTPVPSIWSGLVAHPPMDHVRRAVAGALSLRISVEGDLSRVPLRERERAWADALGSAACSVRDFVDRAGQDRDAAELFVYFLMVTKLAEAHPRAHERGARSEAQPDKAAHGSGEYPSPPSFQASSPAKKVRVAFPPSSAFEAARALKPATGVFPTSTLRPAEASPPPPDAAAPTTHPARPRVSAAAEQSLAQAQMHAILGEHAEAIRLATRALSEEPGLPAAKSFLSYALATRPGDEPRDLPAILRMSDEALARDPGCRRGWFYRAAIKARLGDDRGAMADLKAAVAREPDDADAVRDLRAYERRVEAGELKVGSEPPPSGARKGGGFFRFRLR